MIFEVRIKEEHLRMFLLIKENIQMQVGMDKKIILWFAPCHPIVKLVEPTEYTPTGSNTLIQVFRLLVN